MKPTLQRSSSFTLPIKKAAVPLAALLAGGATTCLTLLMGCQTHLPNLDKDRETLLDADSEIKSMGHALYLQSCSACHGTQGKGKGPVASNFRTLPPDLTQFTRRRGEFPFMEVLEIIDGSRPVKSHGTPSMPVWSKIYTRAAKEAEMETPDLIGETSIYALTRYIESIQEPAKEIGDQM